jgi:hypothetical protein
MRVIAAIEDPDVARKILDCLHPKSQSLSRRPHLHY